MSERQPEILVSKPGYTQIAVPQWELVKAIADLQARVDALEEAARNGA